MTLPRLASPASEFVARWYDAKTDDVLRKYGPGPRIHYHTGVFEEPVPCTRTPRALRSRIVAAQEHLLEVAASVWQAEDNMCGNLLDVGCGLGGGSIFWAERYAASVVALTNVPRHARLVEGFTRESGITGRVIPLVGDARRMPTRGRFDAVVAVESACYLPRLEWMAHVASLLRLGGHLFISDVFATCDAIRGPFDADWSTCLTTATEYEGAARRAGLQLCSNHDLTSATRDFWALTIAYHQSLAAIESRGSRVAARSIVRHRRVADGWRSGALEYRLLAFQK